MLKPEKALLNWANKADMEAPLKILHVEDDLHDLALVRSILEAGGVPCAIKPVQTRNAFVAELEGGKFDLILSDFSMPGFDGASAAELARTRWPAIPFVFVSGTLGEEQAIEMLKAGATDYVLKGNLSRLVPAVSRAMRDVKNRENRQQLEEQVIEGQKMEVIGQLAAGIAHDFNNMLAVIRGHIELMTEKLGTNAELRTHAEEIRHAADRAVGLTRQLLIFSRNESVEPVVLEFDEVVREMEKMLGRLISEDIEMTIMHGAPAGRIKADSGYIGQVLMNLVVNARDAMPTGGKLSIATGNVSLDAAQIRNHPEATAGDYVMLQVSDTGTGMTDEVKARLFEAFFTTKPKGVGTGLGLSTCQSIVRQSGGHIELQSELGRGTTFKVYFPRVEQALKIKEVTKSPWPLPGGNETLLVVEDDSSVRRLAQTVLEARGYKVLSAGNGQEGLRVAREHHGAPISLVISDLIMPVMGGKIMAEWLKTIFPDLKVLFTSGYTDEVIKRNGAFETGTDFLPKPYTPKTLTAKVREILDARQTTMGV